MIRDLFKNRKKLFIIVGCILGLCLLIFFCSKLLGNNGINRFKYEYEKLNNIDSDSGDKYPYVNITSDNKMRYVSYEDIFNVFDNELDAVIYIGYPKCLYCRTATQVLTDTVSDMDIDEIYYLDDENKENGYDKLKELLGEDFLVIRFKKKVINSPLVLFVVNGKIVSYNMGTLISHKDPYEKLDQSQIDELSKIYRDGINTVINSKSANLNT